MQGCRGKEGTEQKVSFNNEQMYKVQKSKMQTTKGWQSKIQG